MKKSTLAYIASTLSTIDFENKVDVLKEIETEINRGMDKKQAKIAEYAENRAIILDALSDTPATIAEIYDSIKADLPETFTISKVQYAITKLYKDEVVKHEGKPNTYTRA